MTGREVILTTLSYKQLVNFKSRFLKLVRQNYSLNEIPANDETIENFILYTAERITMPLVISNTIFLLVVIPAFFKSFSFGMTMVFLAFTGCWAYIFWVSYSQRFNVSTILNMFRLLLRMRMNKIKSPWC